MTESPKLSDDGLSVRLEPEELREVEEELLKPRHRAVLPRKPSTTERSGFARGECIAGKHPVGTKQGCQACESYKASTVVRK